jgi:hypothetical protein
MCGATIRAGTLGELAVVRRLPGRNRTKADIIVCRSEDRLVAVKSYAGRPLWQRHTLGRLLVRREAAAYLRAARAPGLPRFLGRIDAFSLATEWIEARRLADCGDGTVAPERFDRLDAIVAGLHERGVALGDLGHRDVLLAADGSVWIVDLAAAWRTGRGFLRRRLFERFCAADRFALARLRARFAGGSVAAAVAAADPRTVAWHRRARRVKWIWDRLRGAPRLPPIHDHWRLR